MSAMEVDVPQFNGFSYHGKHQPKVAKKAVHFGSSPTASSTSTAAAQVTVVSNSAYKTSSDAKPKHKARRRARHPSKSEDLENDDTGALTKPISSNKAQKIAERDRHSRSGVRGLPKKGIYHSLIRVVLRARLPFVWAIQGGLTCVGAGMCCVWVVTECQPFI